MGSHEPRLKSRAARRNRRRQRAVSWGAVVLGSVFLIASAAMLVARGPVTSGSEWSSLLTGATPQGDAPEIVGDPVDVPWLESRTARPAPAATTVPAGPQQPAKVAVPDAATLDYDVVPGTATALGTGPVVKYIVEVERGLPFDAQEFAAEVHRILNHEQGWGQAGTRNRFHRVESGQVAFRVLLSSPSLTDRVCHPWKTRGKVSCYNGYRAVINARRWGEGTPTYGYDLASYREYVISHEVGHALDNRHVTCPAGSGPAPVMVQQTKSLEGCAANPWPFP